MLGPSWEQGVFLFCDGPCDLELRISVEFSQLSLSPGTVECCQYKHEQNSEH